MRLYMPIFRARRKFTTSRPNARPTMTMTLLAAPVPGRGLVGYHDYDSG